MSADEGRATFDWTYHIGHWAVGAVNGGGPGSYRTARAAWLLEHHMTLTRNCYRNTALVC